MTDKLAELIDEKGSHTREIRITGGAGRHRAMHSCRSLRNASSGLSALCRKSWNIRLLRGEIFGLIKRNPDGEDPELLRHDPRHAQRK